MRTRLYGLAGLLLSAASPVHAQRPAYYFLELGGPGGLVSANVEVNPAAALRLRGGAGLFIWPSLPLTATYTIGTARHSLEVGAGATLVFLSAFESHSSHTAPSGRLELRGRDGTLAVGTALVGHRYTSRRGFLLRAADTPLYAQGKAVMWVGPSVGRGFPQ